MKNANRDEALSESILIKRYRNRRLYSTASNNYTTLADLDQLVQSNKPFHVINVEDQEDVTCLTLLEMLKERSKAGESISRTELLILLRKHAIPRKPDTPSSGARG
jgi:polyhydroxyalkanoate synthesis repressor PhaR